MRVTAPVFRSSLLALSAVAAIAATSNPAGAVDFGYGAADPSDANWPTSAVRMMSPDQSPTLPNAPSYSKGVYVDYSWAFASHGQGDPRYVYSMKLPFVDKSYDGAMPATNPDGTPLQLTNADYNVTCNGTLIGSDYSEGSAAPARQYLCTIVKAPEYDAQQLIQLLSDANWDYTIAFPMSDPGTGRALLFWSSGMIDAASGLQPQHQGFARISGINWQNQFPSTDVALCDYDDQGVCQPNGKTYTFAHADAVGDYIASLGPTYATTTSRGYQLLNGATPSADTGTTAYPAAVIVTDAWVATPPPPLPEVTLVATGAAPKALDISLSGNGVGVGNKGALGSSGPGAVIPFDYIAFCSAPGKSGLPRSQAWINNCIASAPKK